MLNSPDMAESDHEWDRQCEAEDMEEERLKQRVIDALHNDTYGDEPVSQTFPQDAIQWPLIRRQAVLKLRGENVDYEQIGKMVIREMIDYVTECEKGE